MIELIRKKTNKTDFVWETVMSENFRPLLFAGDINVYSVARAFHEAYGIKVRAYGKYPVFPCMGSRILDYRANKEADKQETFFRLVKEYAEENTDSKILLIGCGDSYVELISRNIGKYPDNVVAPYINIDLMSELIHKERFYNMCEKYGIDYPDTFVYKRSMGTDFELPFAPPYIIKPSSGIEYWANPFTTQKKVYKVNTRKDLEKVLDDVYGAGYKDSMIIQNFIPGDDSYMRVLTSYSDRNNKVVVMCLGHVLLEEHTPHGIGNHAVIITEENKELCEKMKGFLDGIGYTGWSNFDIKFDERDGKFKVFEINTRQGRSNYYVTGSGANVAKCFVEDRILEHDQEFTVFDKPHLWRMIPKGVMYKYVNPLYKKQLRLLVKEGKDCHSLIYDKDGGLKRKLRQFKGQMGHYYKFKKYMK